MLFLRQQTKAFYRLPPANRRPDGKAEQHDGSLPPYLHQLRAKRLRASSFLRHRSLNHSHFIFHHLELDEDWKSNKRYAMESIQPQSLKSEEEEWRGRRVWGHVHNSYNGIWDFSQRKRENVEVKNILGRNITPFYLLSWHLGYRMVQSFFGNHATSATTNQQPPTKNDFIG